MTDIELYEDFDFSIIDKKRVEKNKPIVEKLLLFLINRGYDKIEDSDEFVKVALKKPVLMKFVDRILRDENYKDSYEYILDNEDEYKIFYDLLDSIVYELVGNMLYVEEKSPSTVMDMFITIKDIFGSYLKEDDLIKIEKYFEKKVNQKRLRDRIKR